MVLVDKNNFLESIVNKRDNAMDEFNTQKFESFLSHWLSNELQIGHKLEELVERQSKKLYELASDMNYVMNELYKEQKKFLKKQCVL